MRQVLRELRAVLDRRTKVGLLSGTLASTLLAAFDLLAIALVLPLVNLAAGEGADHFTVDWIRQATGVTDDSTLVVVLGVLVVVLFVLKDVGAIAFTWWVAGFKVFNRVRLSSKLLGHYLRAPYTAMAQRSSAELMRTMVEGATQVYGSVAFGLVTMVSGALSTAAIVTALLLSAPLPTLTLLLYLGVASYAYVRYMRPRAQRAGDEASRAAADTWRAAVGALGARKEAKLRSSADYFVGKYEQAALRGARASRQAELLGALPRYLLEILFILGIGLLLVVGATSSGASGAGTVGVLALFVAAGFRIIPAVTQIIGAVSSLRFGSPYLSLVHDELGTVDHEDQERVSPIRKDLRHELRVEDVSFSYPGSSEAALSGVSLTIPRGASVALVGGSGSGKSTLVDIVLGLHVPDEGRVTVDGVDIMTDPVAWQATIGYVPQEVFLLDGSLAENIAFDRPQESMDFDLIWDCVRKAQLGDVVKSWPEGVNTHLGERGSRLSGGQRQRVGIARALYRRPSFLVLDEATSALDNETEYRVSEAVQDLAGEVTVLIVAHRLSTVKNVDKVLLLEDGHVTASGRFADLRGRSETFERLVRLGSLDA